MRLGKSGGSNGNSPRKADRRWRLSDASLLPPTRPPTLTPTGPPPRQASPPPRRRLLARPTPRRAGRSMKRRCSIGEPKRAAREVVRAREAARLEAEKASAAAAQGRRVAAEAQATKYAGDAWRAGESVETQASAALSREDYAAARSLFVEARRQYSTAAQMADIAQEAEARRVEAMMGDARRLLASGEAAACLSRLGEVLTLRPDYAGAEELRQQADGMLRREAAPSPGPAVVTGGPTEAFPAEDRIEHTSREGVAAPPPEDETRILPVAPPPAVRVEEAERPVSPTAVVRETGAQQPAAAIAFPSDHADATRVLEPGGGDSASTGADASVDRLPRSAADARLGRGPFSDARRTDRQARMGRSRRVWLVTGSLVLAAIGLITANWWPRTPSQPVVSSGNPDAAEGLRKGLVAAREEALRVNAEKLAPGQYAAATEKAQGFESALGRQDVASARQRYDEAVEAYTLAKTEALRIAALGRKNCGSPGPGPSRPGEWPMRPRLRASRPRSGPRARRLRPRPRRPKVSSRGTGPETCSARPRAPTARPSPPRQTSEREQAGARERSLADAQRAQASTAQARRDAERAAAPRWAPSIFASAQRKEGEASGLLARQDHASAKLRFQEAQQAYQQAVVEAERVAALQRQQSEAEQGRERLLAARRAAEEARAAQYAPRLVASAQAKERDANAAFARPDYGQATRLFGEALAQYHAAAQEAKRQQEVGQEAKRQQEARRRPSASRRPRRRPSASRKPRRRPSASRKSRRRPSASRKSRRRPSASRKSRRRPSASRKSRSRPSASRKSRR